MRLLLAWLPAPFFALLAPAAPVPTHLMREPVYYYPTTVGTKWEYTDGLSLVVAEVKHGETKIVTVHNDRDKTPFEIIEVSTTKVVRKQSEPGVCNPLNVFLKAPINVGDKWTLAFPAENGDPAWEATCTIAKLETITVPAGTFETVRVDGVYVTKFVDKTSTTELSCWYAHHVGLVQMTDDEDEIVRKLKSFTPGKFRYPSFLLMR